MRKRFTRIVTVGLFSLSLTTAGAAFMVLIVPQSAFGAPCVPCELKDVACPGSPCNCVWDPWTSQYYTQCQLPSQ